MGYGIDPYETKEVTIDGIIFTIGHILSRKMQELRAKLVGMSGQLSEARLDRLSESEIIGITDFNYQLARYGVKGHKNFIVNGKEIEFKTDTAFEFGKTRVVVSEEILEYYALNGLLDKINTDILKLNNLSGEEQKN